MSEPTQSPEDGAPHTEACQWFSDHTFVPRPDPAYQECTACGAVYRRSSGVLGFVGWSGSRNFPRIARDGIADHPYSDPGDGRTECQTCGKWVWLVTHSCKGIPVTQAAIQRTRDGEPS